MDLAPVSADEISEASAGGNTFREDFEVFYRRERRSIVGLACVLSGSRSGAEDLAQEAFQRALRAWDQIGAYDDPGAWVRRVVANQAVSGFRRRTAETKAVLRLGRDRFEIPELSSDALWFGQQYGASRNAKPKPSGYTVEGPLQFGRDANAPLPLYVGIDPTIYLQRLVIGDVENGPLDAADAQCQETQLGDIEELWFEEEGSKFLSEREWIDNLLA